MKSVARPLPSISERLTWAQICERYPDQELCLVEVDCIHPHNPAIHSARVIGHGATTQDAVDQALLVRDLFDMVTFESTRPRRTFQPPRSHSTIDDEPLEIFHGPRIVLDAETGEPLFARTTGRR